MWSATLHPSNHFLLLIHMPPGLARCSRQPSHQQHFLAPPGGSQGAVRPAGICCAFSKAWAYPHSFAQLGVPETPISGGITKAS